jgi:hypothetical protein
VGEEEMNTVAYAMPLQGFRRTRGMGSQAMPLVLANPTPSTPEQVTAAAIAAGGPIPDVSSLCSEWDFYFNQAAWTQCAQAAIAAGPQTVPANAKAAGYSPDVVAAAQTAADQQSSQAAADAQNIATYYGAGQLLYTPGSPNNPLGLPNWLWFSLLAAGGLVLWKVLS